MTMLKAMRPVYIILHVGFSSAASYPAYPGYQQFITYQTQQIELIKSLIHTNKMPLLFKRNLPTSFEIDVQKTLIDYAIKKHLFASCLELIKHNFQVSNKNLATLERLFKNKKFQNRNDNAKKRRKRKHLLHACIQTIIKMYYSDTYLTSSLPNLIINHDHQTLKYVLQTHNINPNFHSHTFARLIEIAIAHGDITTIQILSNHGTMIYAKDIKKADDFLNIARFADISPELDHAYYPQSPHSVAEIAKRQQIFEYLSRNLITSEQHIFGGFYKSDPSEMA